MISKQLEWTYNKYLRYSNAAANTLWHKDDIEEFDFLKKDLKKEGAATSRTT